MGSALSTPAPPEPGSWRALSTFVAGIPAGKRSSVRREPDGYGNTDMPVQPLRPPAPVAALLGGSLFVGMASGEVTTAQDPQTGLRSWTWDHRGVSVQLVQRLPDQTRAFFLGRGFASQDADRIGRSCVFQTIFRNDGAQPVEYDLTAWSVIHLTERLPLRTREVWDPEWEARGVAEAARTAFRWSLLPTVQRFEPGDYNWGMTSFGLAPGELFDLSLLVTVSGEPTAAEVPSVVCAADR